MLTATEESIQTLNIVKEIRINAPLEVAFEAELEELGPGFQKLGGVPFPMVFEAWPGGRWYRDLGNDSGHFWGQVQVIKPPTLLEIRGPLFMSYPAVNFVQYRLTEEEDGTHLRLTHRALGLIAPEHRDGVSEGWSFIVGRIREMAERGRLV